MAPTGTLGPQCDPGPASVRDGPTGPCGTRGALGYCQTCGESYLVPRDQGRGCVDCYTSRPRPASAEATVLRQVAILLGLDHAATGEQILATIRLLISR